MGTNFYAYDIKTNEKLYHIGKRSAAGHFCWDCGMSYMNVAKIYWSGGYAFGNDAVHYSDNNKTINGEPVRLDHCPICGKPSTKDEKITSGFAELGFSSQPTKNHNTTCSFSFAITPYTLSNIMKDDNIYIKDEYNRTLTKEEFKIVLQNCGLKYFNFIGSLFS